MTKRRHSATTRSVPAQTPEQLLELAQEYIRPLIGVIDRLNEADAEDELQVISKQLSGCPSGCSHSAEVSSPKDSASARRAEQAEPSRILSNRVRSL
jgi:hypothetical protein